MRVLVTGAYGYVGRAVVRRLVAAGHEVVALTRRTPRPELPAHATVRGDIRDSSAVRAAVAGVDGVCHLAALTRVRESFERPAEYRAVNTEGTVTLLDALAAAGTRPMVVLASTAAVYGAPERQPITEDTPPAPSSPYGATKLAAEQALLDRAAAGTVRATVLRCFNVTGSDDTDPTRIIPRTLAVAAGHHPHLDVNGDGSAVRDFVHVDDLADAYLLALTAPVASRVYNVGATAASVRDIITAAEHTTGRPIPVRHLPPQPEPPRLLADTTRITTELGWAPERSTLDRLIADAWRQACKPLS